MTTPLWPSSSLELSDTTGKMKKNDALFQGSTGPLHDDDEEQATAALESTPLVVPSSSRQQQQQTSVVSHLSAHPEQPPSDDEHSFCNKIPPNKLLMGRILLFTTAFLYGTLNVTLRWIYALPGPPSASALSCTRGWLATLCFAPFLMMPQQPTTTTVVNSSTDATTTASSTTTPSRRLSLWRMGLELAVWNFGAQGLVNLGLLSVESARAAFLTQTSVVMTPVLSWATGHAVHSTVWMACILALTGLVFLSWNGDYGLGHFGAGDLLCLGGALSWSTYIFRLSFCQGYDEIHLQAVKTFLLAVLYTIWFVLAEIYSDTSLWPGHSNWMAWVLLWYSALGPGTVADIIQNKGQLTVSAAEGNVILSSEPVFTSLLGLLLLGEALSWQEVCGGGLIITAAVVATR